MKLIDKKELSLQLKSLTKAIKMTTERVQTIAVQAIAYSILNKDAQVANELFVVVNQTKSLRKDSLVKYLETMGHLAFDTKEKKFGFLVNAKIGCKPGVFTPEHEANVLALRWDNAKAEPKLVSEWDMEAQFRAFIGRMQKIVIDPAVAEGKVKVKNHDVLTALSREFNRIGAEKVLKSMVVDKDVIEQGEKMEAALAAKAEATLPVIEPGLAVVNG
jgi:hypothetical protein